MDQRHNSDGREHPTTDVPPSQSSEVAPPPRHEIGTDTSGTAAPPPDQVREILAVESKRVQVRSPEPEAVTLVPARHTVPVEARTLSLRVGDAADQRVDLRISEHQGEVRVSVRTADEDLASSLRDNLGDLVQKLEQSGLHAENWQPTHAASAAGDHADRQRDNDFTGGQQPGQQQQQQSRGGHHGQQQDSKRGLWFEEIENSLASDAKGKIYGLQLK
jgi:hypothetical protein